MITNIDTLKIWELFKNKYPLLMIDYVEQIDPGKSAQGFKNFSNNEWFFPIHFADNPNVPGCIMLESLLQMFIMGFIVLPECKGKETSDIKVNNLVFKRTIRPGERLDIKSTIVSFRRGIATGFSKGYVGDILACSCDIIVCIPEMLNYYTPSTK